MTLDELARRFDAYVAADNTFQRSARTLQSIWRQEKGYAAGLHRGGKLGSRLATEDAKRRLWNFLSDQAKAAVHREVMDPRRCQDRVFQEPRIYDNLLSSQPLAFSLFAPLGEDLALASAVFRDLTGGCVTEVTDLRFEYSPGRGDNRYTEDRSAFDVYLEFRGGRQARGFIGIEVKYHEDLTDAPARPRPRYDEVAQLMGCFDQAAMPRLRTKPLQQLWRDHLLAGALRAAGEFQTALFAITYPAMNQACSDAIAAYRACLCDSSMFRAWTLEELVGAIERHTTAGWVAEFRDRYLDFGKLDRYRR